MGTFVRFRVSAAAIATALLASSCSGSEMPRVVTPPSSPAAAKVDGLPQHPLTSPEPISGRLTVEEMRKEVRATLDEALTVTDNSVTGVEINEAMTVFTLKVDGEKFASMDKIYGVTCKMLGLEFQQYFGVKSDDVVVTVQFVDDKSGKVLYVDSLHGVP